MTRSYPRQRVEVRLVCSDETHRHHCWTVRDLDSAFEKVEKAQTDPVYVDPIPDKRTCLPLRIETRHVGPWLLHPWDPTRPGLFEKETDHAS